MMQNGLLVWTIDDFYNQYVNHMAGLKQAPLPKDKYVAGFHFYFKEIQRAIIRGGYTFNMHYELGTKLLRKTPKKNFRDKDFSNLKYNFEIYWRKDRAAESIKEKQLYEFIPCKGDPAVNGKKGLKKWQKHASEDPYIKSLDAAVL